MKKLSLLFCIASCLLVAMAFVPNNNKNEWQSLFDGKSLDNWKVGDNATTFKVENGMIVANGDVAHLFYNGDVNNHSSKILNSKHW